MRIFGSWEELGIWVSGFMVHDLLGIGNGVGMI